MLFIGNPRCPHCAAIVTPATLRRLRAPAPGKWYGFTPARALACPVCAGKVRATASDSPWLWLAVLPLLVPLAVARIERLAFLGHGPWFAAWIALAALGLYRVVRGNRLVADTRDDA